MCQQCVFFRLCTSCVWLMRMCAVLCGRWESFPREFCEMPAVPESEVLWQGVPEPGVERRPPFLVQREGPGGGR